MAPKIKSRISIAYGKPLASLAPPRALSPPRQQSNEHLQMEQRVQAEFVSTMLSEEKREEKFEKAMKQNTEAARVMQRVQTKKREASRMCGLQPLYAVPNSPDYKSCNGWQDANRIYEAHEIAQHEAHAQGVALIRRKKMSEWRNRVGR